MQFLKKHHLAILYVVVALFLSFFGHRLFADSVKFGDVIFFAFFCSALLILPAVELGEKILKLLGEPKAVRGQPLELHAQNVLYPAIKAALAELEFLRPGFNHCADRAFNHLHRAYWSETPSPAGASRLRPVGGCTCGPNEGCIACASSGAQADQAAEAEIVAAGLTAPRVTKDQIELLMGKLIWRYEQPEGTTSTFAHAFLGRFYLATGHSACVSPENFNAELGMKYAREQAEGKARDKLWELEGYKLWASQAANQAQ